MANYIRSKNDENQWNMFFSVLFAVLLLGLGWIFWNVWGGFPQTINWFDAIILSLAVMRATRLLVYDKITRFAREWFANKREIHRDGMVEIEVFPVKSGPRRAIGDLLDCPWCVGVWVALIFVGCYYLFAWAWYILFILAIAGVGTLLQILGNRIGWSAENLKLDAEEKGSSKKDVY